MISQPRLTVAILALNEERNLAELLPQLTWADETLVVDGGSRDRSREVAVQYGARVLWRRFDDFAAQRNHALDAATGEWVLMLDADERPTPRLVSEIAWRIATEKHAAYRTPIRSQIFGRQMRYSGTQDDQPIRLVRRNAARWHGAVHEACRVEGRIGRLRNWLRHCTLPSAEAFLDKMHRYTRLEAAARVARQEPPRRRDAWIAPPREVCRRLFWKLGVLDGPEGWAFCALSGLSAWVGAREHWKQWQQAHPRDVTPRHAFPRLFAEGGAA